MSSYVNTNIQDMIGYITLSREDSLNALNLPTAQELGQILLRWSADDTIRSIIITGSGKAFSAGGDIKGAVAHPNSPAAVFHEMATFVHLCIVELRRMRKPVIAAINGIAAGGGFALALACDFRIMAQSARLKQGFTSNALCIDGGTSHTLPRLVGFARALEIAAFDEPISAEQALSWGLVTKVVDDADLLDAATEMAQMLTTKSLHTFGWAKELLTDTFDTPLERQLEKERQGLVSCVAHPDGQEGIQAFLEKRKPQFRS